MDGTTETTETSATETAAPPHEVKIERGFSRSFMIKLSDADIATRAREVSRLLRSIETKEEARDRAKKQANNEIDELQASVKRLSDEVHDGEERRDIPCERHFIYRLGVVQVIRTDTKEVVEERAMDARERQTELPLENGSEAASDEEGDDDDEGDESDDEDSDEDEDSDDTEEEPEPHLATAKGNGGGSAGGRGKGGKGRGKR